MLKKIIAVATFFVSFIELDASKDDLSALTYEEFDAFGTNWRLLGDQGRYLEAVELLDRYRDENPEGKNYRSILEWHAGQLLAFAEKYDAAIDRFKTCYQDVDEGVDVSKSYPRQWNAYVDATIAFLVKDREALLKNRGLIEAGPEGKMKELNGAVVDRFIAGFDQTYAEAYSPPPIEIEEHNKSSHSTPGAAPLP